MLTQAISSCSFFTNQVKNCVFFFTPGLTQVKNFYSVKKMWNDCCGVGLCHDSAKHMQCLRCIIQVTCGFSDTPFCTLFATIIKLFYIICKVCDCKCFKIIFGLCICLMYQWLLVLCFLLKMQGMLSQADRTNQIVRKWKVCQRRNRVQCRSLSTFAQLENSYPGKTKGYNKTPP